MRGPRWTATVRGDHTAPLTNFLRNILCRMIDGLPDLRTDVNCLGLGKTRSAKRKESPREYRNLNPSAGYERRASLRNTITIWHGNTPFARQFESTYRGYLLLVVPKPGLTRHLSSSMQLV